MAGFTTQDGTAPTPLNSPLAYQAIMINLTVPDNAEQLVLTPSTTLKVSEDPTMTRYCLVATGTEATFDVSLLQHVYIAQYASPGTVNFRFSTV